MYLLKASISWGCPCHSLWPLPDRFANMIDVRKLAGRMWRITKDNKDHSHIEMQEML